MLLLLAKRTTTTASNPQVGAQVRLLQSINILELETSRWYPEQTRVGLEIKTVVGMSWTVPHKGTPHHRLELLVRRCLAKIIRSRIKNRRHRRGRLQRKMSHLHLMRACWKASELSKLFLIRLVKQTKALAWQRLRISTMKQVQSRHIERKQSSKLRGWGRQRLKEIYEKTKNRLSCASLAVCGQSSSSKKKIRLNLNNWSQSRMSLNKRRSGLSYLSLS